MILVGWLLLLAQNIGGGASIGGVSSVGGGVPAAAIARVNQGAFGALTISSEAVTQALGWTVGSGHFLTVFAAAGSGSIISSVVANPGAYAMTQAAYLSASHNVIGLYYLPNTTSGINSITINWTSSNGSTVSLEAAEYSGLSTTAAPVSAGLTNDSGFVTVTTWTSSAYTAVASGLLISCSANNGAAGSFTSGSGWTQTASYGGGTTPETTLQEILAPSAGSISGTGTWSVGTAGQYYDNAIVEFK